MGPCKLFVSEGASVLISTPFTQILMEASNREHNYLIKILSTFLPTAGSAQGDVTKIQTRGLGGS